jgi:signal transduction histidine kinase
VPRTAWIVLLGVPVAVVIAATIAAQTYLSMLDHGHTFARLFAWQLAAWIYWPLVAPLVLRGSGAWRRLALLGPVLITGHIAVHAAAAALLQPYQPILTATFRAFFVGQLQWLVPIDVVAYLWLVLMGWAVAAQDKARRLAIRESRLEADLARAQLEVLRLEIQPHFLFNTLNAISALIRMKANDRALDMLVGLSDLMRHSLDRSGEQVVPLHAELDFVKRYVGLQQARFGDRLAVSYEIPDDCADLPVPAFVLQPIVENALRHGVARVARPCRIDVRATRDPDGTLQLSIADDGVGLPPGFSLEHDAHTGLGNIRSRLQRLYGAEARLTVGARPGGGVVTEVSIPRRPEVAAGATA